MHEGLSKDVTALVPDFHGVQVVRVQSHVANGQSLSCSPIAVTYTATLDVHI